MANTRANLQRIPLTASLNLDQAKFDIRPFEGFNKRNSPFVGNVLQPVYNKVHATTATTAITSSGKLVELYPDGRLTIDGELVYTYPTGTKFLHSHRVKLESSVLAFYTTSDGFVCYTAAGKVERYALVDGKFVRKWSTSFSVDASCFTFYVGAPQSTHVTMFAWDGQYSVTTAILNYTTGALVTSGFSTLAVPSLSPNIGSSYIFTEKPDSSHLFLTLVPQSGAGQAAPVSYTYCYNIGTASLTLVSASPATISCSTVMPESSTSDDYYPDFHPQAGKYFTAKSNMGLSVGSSSSTVTGTVEARYYVQGNRCGVSIYADWSKIRSVSYTFYWTTPDNVEHSGSSASVATQNGSGNLSPGEAISCRIHIHSITSIQNTTATISSGADSSFSRSTGSQVSTCSYSYVTTTPHTEFRFYKKGSFASYNGTNNTITVSCSSPDLLTFRCWQKTHTYGGKTVSQVLKTLYEVTPDTFRFVLPISYQQSYTNGYSYWSPCHVLVDGDTDSVYLNPGVGGDSTIPYGARKVSSTGFSVLVNYGVYSGVSFTSNPGEGGVLVSDWLSIPDNLNLRPSSSGSFCSFMDETQNEVICCYYDTNPTELNVFFDYVVIATENHNLLESGAAPRTVFGDYNNRQIPGVPYSDSITFPSRSLDIFTNYPTGGAYCLYATAINALYEVSKDNFPGLLLPFQTVYKHFAAHTSYLETFKTAPVSGTYSRPIECFFAEYDLGTTIVMNTDIVPAYQCSLSSNGWGIDGNYLGLMYPATPASGAILPVPVFSKYILSYVSHDLIEINGTAYPVLYNGLAEPVLGYFQLAALGNVSNCFVIQGQPYVYTSQYIRQLIYSQGALVSQDVIAPCIGLQFIGFDTQTAFFYSPFERAIYAFTGDNVLHRFAQATEITWVGAWCYNAVTGSVLVATNLGVLVLSSTMGSYLLDFQDVEDIYATKDSLFIITYNASSGRSVNKITLFPEDGSTLIPVKIETAFYGFDAFQQTKIDTIYIRFFSPTPVSGSIKIQATVLTDVDANTETREFQVKTTDWNKATKSFYLRYQPKYQTAVGTSIFLETSLPVQSISFGATPVGVSQLTKNSV